ncbi:MAG: hypothetical protein WCL44_13060 [bacterium]
METWKKEFTDLVAGLLGNPASSTDLAILAVTAVLACLICLRITSSVFGLKRTSWWAVIIVLVVTSAAVLAAATAVRVFMPAGTASAGLRFGLQVGAALLTVLVIGIPSQALLQKASFLESLFCFATTLIIAALITAGACAGLSAIRTGGEQMQRAAERNKEVDVQTEGTVR